MPDVVETPLSGSRASGPMNPFPPSAAAWYRVRLLAAWAEALTRRGIRVVLRRSLPKRPDPYDTAPLQLSAVESERLAEILARHQAS